MKDTVKIKAIKSGLTLVLDPDADWGTIKKQIAEKFQSSASFWGKEQRALSFQGRTLTEEQQEEVLDIIRESCNLQIVCILEKNKDKEAYFTKAVEEILKKGKLGKKQSEPVVQENVPEIMAEAVKELEKDDTGFFFKGSLRSGQVLDVETSIVILGDVKAGAKVVSKGNVIILGSLRGNVYAGVAGNVDAFVIALDMKPIQIRIANTIARSPDEPQVKDKKKKKKKDKKQEQETKIAFWEDGNIYIEPLNQNVIGDIRLS